MPSDPNTASCGTVYEDVVWIFHEFVILMMLSLADEIPFHALIGLFSHLPSEILLACTAVSRTWRESALDNTLWMTIYSKEYSLDDLTAYHEETLAQRPEDITDATWHSLYVSRKYLKLRFGEIYQGELCKHTHQLYPSIKHHSTQSV